VLLDNFSHFILVHPLRTKYEPYDKIMNFQAYVKNQFHANIKAFQCDHGGEFDNGPF